MFKFQFNFLYTGEISESDFIYKFPHTAKQGALAFLRDSLKHRDRSPDERAELRIFKEGKDEPIIYLGGKPLELQELTSWLQGYKAYQRGEFVSDDIPRMR